MMQNILFDSSVQKNLNSVQKSNEQMWTDWDCKSFQNPEGEIRKGGGILDLILHKKYFHQT